ncbi:MAG: hypothetical protein LVQ95_00400 [Candidatus Micrarchaeales archaeon]|nr:hypothetical protein [Candidatus Micrarchaeales archaeon]
MLFLPVVMLDILAGGIISEIIAFALIFLVVFLVFKLGGALLHIIAGLLINSVLGLISIWLLNMWFALGITFSLLVIVGVAIFGLPAVVVIVILRLLGYPV